ncbi:MAG: hypothetical protein ACI9WH_001057, partial [Glaciecola sp.]
MFHYLKFFHYYVIVLLGCVCLLFADYFILIGFTVFTSIYVIGDTLLGDDTSTPILTNKLIINAMLYGSGPLSGILLLIAVWLVTPYEWAFM